MELKFLREYPSTASGLERKLSQVHGDYTLNLKDVDRSVVNNRQFWIDHKFSKYRIIYPSGDKALPLHDKIGCVGEHSGFIIYRYRNSEKFKIFQTHRNGVYDDINYTMTRYVNSSFCVYGYPLYSWLKNPDFKLTSMTSELYEGRACVRVKFDVGPNGKGSHLNVVLDPSRNWAILFYEMRLDIMNMSSLASKIQYDDSTFPLPFRIEDKDINNKWSIVDFHNVRFEGTAEAEFHMPFYGLPDIADDDSGGTFFDRFVKYAIPIGVALVLAYLFKRYARRMNRSPST
jgi:hypothetical protein